MIRYCRICTWPASSTDSYPRPTAVFLATAVFGISSHRQTPMHRYFLVSVFGQSRPSCDNSLQQWTRSQHLVGSVVKKYKKATASSCVAANFDQIITPCDCRRGTGDPSPVSGESRTLGCEYPRPRGRALSVQDSFLGRSGDLKVCRTELVESHMAEHLSQRSLAGSTTSSLKKFRT